MTTRQTLYRKKRGTDLWHWCENCSTWPRQEFDTYRGPPGIGQLCEECKLLDRVNQCEESPAR